MNAPKSQNSFDISAAACSSSQKIRTEALEAFLAIHDQSKGDAALKLLQTPYKDLSEAILQACTSDIVNTDSFRNALIAALPEVKSSENDNYRQLFLVLLQRLEKPLERSLADFCLEALHAKSNDVRYQAFCVAELNNESSPDYIDFVRTSLNDGDEDIRIVAIQAVERLRPEWGTSALSQRAGKAIDTEACHLFITLLKICTEAERPLYSEKLLPYLEDDRFSFTTLQVLAERGTADAVPHILPIAKSFFSEPTVRVTAAFTAAKLGSDEGMNILKKLSESRHGNPTYAKQLLAELPKTAT
ncbi:MAG: hypothetical protein IJ165_14080 [Proteobacteria bacterium]|nr:hypothetical protein [Pseudomonadota bacterium]